ncbi:uncharacterized protein LOC6526849 [Drosophila yakuba]|uniref:Uncharacterized protein n=1 Tax=Drosophila yakuba TaxID=7245 RepID=B4NYZ7_DROYA|nr:uncharacterized protein LOC6526849 [Drosophila yakuba]EDW87661.1 uncharacterized protein Dyak_GE18302 [Drosophila yakuba]
MSATNKEIGKATLAAQQIRQMHQYESLMMILERCDDFPRKTQSDYSLTRINFKSTDVLDASTADLMATGSATSRLPAGATCSCRSTSERSKPAGLKHDTTATDSKSNQTVSTEDIGTQTGFQTDPNEDCIFDQGASNQSMLNVQDAETQSTPELSKNRSSIQTQTEYEEPNTARFTSKSQPSKTKHEDEKATKSNSSLRKCFFKRPLIVVKGGTLMSSDFTANVHQIRTDNVLVSTRKEDKQTQYENPSGSQSEITNISSDRPSGPATCSQILDRVQELEIILKRQERSLRDLQGSVKSWKAQECKPSDCRTIFQVQPEERKLPRKPETRDQASQEERKLPRNPETFEQGSQKKDIVRCEKLELPRKPETFDRSAQKRETAHCKCNTQSKEFIQIFMKPETAQEAQKSNKYQHRSEESNENSRMNNPRCYKENGNEISQKYNQISTANQCLKNTQDFLQKFDRVFAKTKSEETICDKSRNVAETKQIERQNDMEQRVENLLDEFVELVKKPKSDSVSARKVSSTSCLEAKSSRQSNPSVEKEVYKSLIEQLISLFTKSKSCENKVEAQKAESESFSFDRLLAEFINMFTRSNSMEENRPKKVTISEKETILGTKPMSSCNCSRAHRNVKSTAMQSDLKMSDMDLDLNAHRESCQFEGKSTLSEIIRNNQRRDPPPRGCQFCGDGNLPILDSLLDDLFWLIGPRAFEDVVLTILRQEENVYHIKVREMATGNDLGCILGNGKAINQAIGLGVFEDIHTFCELDKHREHDPRDCPLGTSLDAFCPRERGGEFEPDGCVDKERVVEFCTRVLGLPAGQAGRFFSLTNALKLAKKSSVDCSGLLLHGKNRELTGIGAVTESDVSKHIFTTKDSSDVVKTSSLFLRIISGQDNEVPEDDDSSCVFDNHNPV